MRIYVYVDGESHFIQSDRFWKKRHGTEAELEDAVHLGGVGSSAYPDCQKPLILIDRKGKFLWDKSYHDLPMSPFRGRSIDGAVYFTAFSGGEIELHAIRVAIRKWGFDPQVVKERGELAGQREHRLTTQAVIEKPKGVDIGLTVRLLEDAYRHVFDVCFLFTSDVDYIPVIKAIQAIGTKVVVFGYKDGLGGNSELEYVPDQFVELSEHVHNKYSFQKKKH
jgi:uncharacterized LabA/DUF88 family protein